MDDEGGRCETVDGMDCGGLVDGGCVTDDDVDRLVLSVVVVVGGVVVEDGVEVVVILTVEVGGGCERVDDGGGGCETGEDVDGGGRCETVDGVDCGGCVDGGCVMDDGVD